MILPAPRRPQDDPPRRRRAPDRLGGIVFGLWMWACVTCWVAAVLVPGGGRPTRIGVTIAVMSWALASVATAWLVIDSRHDR